METCELKEFTELEKQTLDDTVVELQHKVWYRILNMTVCV